MLATTLARVAAALVTDVFLLREYAPATCRHCSDVQSEVSGEASQDTSGAVAQRDAEPCK